THTISGIEMHDSGCRRARFETTHRFEARPTSQVTVVSGRREASLTAHWLFGPPPMVAEPAQVRPGEPLTLTLVPPDPSWPSYDVPTTIRLFWPDEVSEWIEDEGFRWQDGRFQFEMPEVRPGPVTITTMPTFHRELEIAR